MICVSVSVSEKRRCFVCCINIDLFLIMEMFYSFEKFFTLFDLPLYSFPSVGVNRSAGVTVYLQFSDDRARDMDGLLSEIWMVCFQGYGWFSGIWMDGFQ